MSVPTLSELLATRPYPGRGVAAAALSDGTLCLGYLLSGRSAASRQRALVTLPSGDVEVRSTEPDAADDPLRHYVAVARRGDMIVVGNGTQVMHVADALASGRDMIAAFAEHDFEPDAPIFTPRVWAATIARPGSSVTFGIAMRSARASGSSDHVTWTPSPLTAGEGVLLTTYDGTAEQVRTATAPASFGTTAGSVDEFVAEIWDAVDPEVRVAAVAFDPVAEAIEPHFRGRRIS